MTNPVALLRSLEGDAFGVGRGFGPETLSLLIGHDHGLFCLRCDLIDGRYPLLSASFRRPEEIVLLARCLPRHLGIHEHLDGTFLMSRGFASTELDTLVGLVNQERHLVLRLEDRGLGVLVSFRPHRGRFSSKGIG